MDRFVTAASTSGVSTIFVVVISSDDPSVIGRSPLLYLLFSLIYSTFSTIDISFTDDAVIDSLFLVKVKPVTNFRLLFPRLKGG